MIRLARHAHHPSTSMGSDESMPRITRAGQGEVCVVSSAPNSAVTRSPSRRAWLALQLHSRFEVSAPRGGLMGASPARPCDDVSGSYTALSKLVGDPPNLLDRPADQILMVRILDLFGGVTLLARYRITAIMAKASMTRETWRCQPCHERLSL